MIQFIKNTKSKKLYEESDGWDLNGFISDELNEVLSDISRLKYELDRCVRGAYTGCKTYEQLGEYIIELAHTLEDAGSYIQENIDDNFDEAYSNNTARTKINEAKENKVINKRFDDNPSDYFAMMYK